MKQDDLNDALAAYLNDGDDRAWLAMVEAIRAGHVTVSYGKTRLQLKAVEYPVRAAFARRLKQLQLDSGLTQQEIATRSEISLSAVIRLLNGETKMRWSGVKWLIIAMEGNPDDFRADYGALDKEGQDKLERRRRIAQ